MFFSDSRPDRKRRDPEAKARRKASLASSPIPLAHTYELLTDADLREDRTLVFDCESYPNYFLAAFKCMTSGKVIYFENTETSQIDTQKLAYVMHRFLLIGFWSKMFDIPLLRLAMQGHRAAMLHETAMLLISDAVRPWELEKQHALPRLRINDIDLKEVAPLDESLKIYAGRLHCKRMQDLPFNPHTELTLDQMAVVRDYCINDLDSTALLADHLKPQIELREHLGNEYDQDLRSKSDAQIAEAIIGSELDKLRSVRWELADKQQRARLQPGNTFRYIVPDFIKYKLPQLQELLQLIAQTDFVVSDGGKPKFPREMLDYKSPTGALKVIQKRNGEKTSISVLIGLGRQILSVAAGGIHSSEKAAAHVASAGTLLIDRDVASYYPAIILNQGLYPSHLGPDFLKVYQTIVNRRLRAKLEKNKTVSEALKITINGTFGKLGNVFSRMYAPDLLMQVTISGQLCLLMLIEAVELAGIPVISANTDGIIIKCPANRYKDLETVILTWEAVTGFATEETQYKAIYSRDVNNYIAVKLDGECKTKGIYSERGSALNSVLSKNPECNIVSDALQHFLASGTPLQQTITTCRDIRKFVSVRTVKGGAEKSGVYLGKAIRWYYAKDEKGTINYVESGNKVPKSEGAKPLMILPDALPADLDFEYYINEASEALFDLGYYQRPQEARLF